MSHLTPELEAILDKLAETCIETLQGESLLDYDEVSELVESLQRNSFARHANQRLIEYLRSRVLAKIPEQAMHRPESVTAVCQQVQELYNLRRFNDSLKGVSESESESLDPKAET